MSIALPSQEARWQDTTRRQNEILKARLAPPPPTPVEKDGPELRELLGRLDHRAVGVFVAFLVFMIGMIVSYSR